MKTTLRTIAILVAISVSVPLFLEACHRLGGVAARSDLERTLIR